MPIKIATTELYNNYHKKTQIPNLFRNCVFFNEENIILFFLLHFSL
jgi:hypothetical protein